MISGILLSAGESSRFGSPKALADWQGESIIEHILKTLELSEVSEIIVVLGAHEKLIKPFLLEHKRIKVVYNKDHKFGQTSSFQAGVDEASISSQGFLLWPVDYPCISLEAIQVLSREHSQDHHSILIPTYNGQKGHPPIFPATLKEIILDLPRDSGVNSLITQHEDLVKYVPLHDPGVRMTFNTSEELEQLKS